MMVTGTLEREAHADWEVRAWAKVDATLASALRYDRLHGWLNSRGWHAVGRSPQWWCAWRRGGRQHAIGVAVCLAAADEHRRRLRQGGWRQMPDGSTASFPTHAGLRGALGVERQLSTMRLDLEA